MASTETLADADRAAREGWRVSVVVPADHPRLSRTPEGRAVVVCPEQASGRVTCNDCRLCDASKAGPVIAFREHGNGSARAARAVLGRSAPAPVVVPTAPPSFETFEHGDDGENGCRCECCTPVAP
jgi:hypothetical protein